MTDLDLFARDHFVYVYWRDDEPLYVGMTCDLRNRLTAHRSAPHGKSATHVDVWLIGKDRAEAEAVESAAIRDLDPLHNIANSPRVERDREAWMNYSEWSRAFYAASWGGEDDWSCDQEYANAVCAAAGLKAPDLQRVRRQRHDQLLAAAQASWDEITRLTRR